jgi:hypothetical protein
MKSNLLDLTFEIEVQEDEALALPEALVRAIGTGRWIISIQPLNVSTAPARWRSHAAFLHSYAPEDEGLYDEYPSR